MIPNFSKMSLEIALDMSQSVFFRAKFSGVSLSDVVEMLVSYLVALIEHFVLEELLSLIGIN